MTRRTIGGTLDSSGMALLASLHRPTDQAQLAAAARDLVAGGLSVRDIAMAMRISPRAVAELLNFNQESDPCA